MSKVIFSNKLKRIFYILFCFAVWSPSSFAVQTLVANGPLNATGEAEGVAVNSGAGITLTIGTQDVFTDNIAGPFGISAISTDNNATNNIVFGGNSTVYGNIGTNLIRFLDITALAGAGTVNINGTVFTTTMNIATGTVNFNSGTGTNVGAVNFTGDGTINLAPNTTVTGALTTGAAETGTLNLGNASQWTGAVGGASGLRAIGLTGSGTAAGITGAVDTYSFNLGDGTLNVAGDIRIRNPGPNSINTTLTSDTVYGRIVATGGATTLPATLGVNVTVPATTVLTPGTTFNIVDSTSGPGTSVVAITIQNPTNPLYTFIAVPATTLNGDVNILLTGTPVTSVSLPVGPALPLPVIAAVNTLTTTTAVTNALEQLAPSTGILEAPWLSFQRTQQFQNLWLSRLDICRGDKRLDEKNPTACRENEPQSGWWVKGFGHAGEQDAQQDTLGYDSIMGGTMVAYDVPINRDTRAGFGIGFARGTLDGNKHENSTDIDTIQATAYIGHERGPWYLHGSASFGWNEYSGSRNVVFPGVNQTADADYSGQDYTAFVSTGYRFPVQEFIITPNASLQYTYMDLDGFVETGSDINLAVESQDYDFAELGLGVKVERDYNYNGRKVIPEIHFNWFNMLSNPRTDPTARFAAGTASFVTQGHDVADNTYNVGAGFTIISCGVCDAITWSLDATYDYEWRDDGYSSNQGMLRLAGRF